MIIFVFLFQTIDNSMRAEILPSLTNVVKFISFYKTDSKEQTLISVPDSILTLKLVWRFIGNNNHYLCVSLLKL